MFKKVYCLFLVAVFTLQSLWVDVPLARAEWPSISLPAAGQMISLSTPWKPVMLQGLRYDSQKPFRFQFIVQQGDKPLPLDQLRDEGMHLVRYFMAAMTMPEEDLWVNLSPYEKNRIIPNGLEVTRLGSDMLAQDYILKQMASSLTFPNSLTGRAFWQKIYSVTEAYFGSTNLPVSTFNKVWIVPDYAEVFVRGNTVVITKSHLKVMMEQDYLARKKAACGQACASVLDEAPDKNQTLASAVMRQIIIPILDKEVNTGSNFAALRQIFHAVVLAEWYKRNLKESLFNQYYADRHEVAGINDVNEAVKEAIYQRYLTAYKKGVYNFIREDSLPGLSQPVARKYFSGGLGFTDTAMVTRQTADPHSVLEFSATNPAYLMDVGALPAPALGTAPDRAMTQIITIFNRMRNSLRNERKVSLKVQEAMKEIDPLIISKVVDKPVRITEGWEKIEYTGGSIHFFDSRVGLNISRPQNRSFEDGNTRKGGIRYYVKGSDLMKEDAFREGWEHLNQMKAPLEDFAKYIALYMRYSAWNLAFLMFEKVQLLGLPLGGAKADVFIGNVVQKNGKFIIEDLEPAYQKEVLQKIAQKHGETLAPFVGIGKDVPAPDVNTSDLMDIYIEEYLKWLVQNHPEEFKDPELRSILEDFLEAQQQAISRNPYKYAVGQTPFLELLHKYGREHPGTPLPWAAVYSGIKLGGIAGRTEATGFGVTAVLTTYLKETGIDFKGMTMSVQGMGAVGFNTAISAIEKGIKVTHFSENGIAVIKEDGWSKEQLIHIKDEINKERKQKPGFGWREYFLEDVAKPEGERIFALPGVTVIINLEPELVDGELNPKWQEKDLEIREAVLGAPVDILVPAFLGNQITGANWRIVKARFIAEGANHPVEGEAETELTKTGHVILSGILSNANGVYTSYLQILQDLQGRKFAEQETWDLGIKKLTAVTQEVVRILKENPQMSFGEACELRAWKNAAWERLKNTIDRTHGELNEMMKFYEPNVTAETMLRRIRDFNLQGYLHEAQAEDLEIMRRKIFKQLAARGFLDISGSLNEGTELDMYNLLGPVLRKDGTSFGETMALARTLYRILDGNGETVSQAAKRLERLKYTVSQIKQLRLELLERISSLLADPHLNGQRRFYEKFYALLQERIHELDDVPAVSSSIRDKAMAANGGIDFDAGHMLISQQGEAAFKSQAVQLRLEKWQQIKGFVPIFLRMVPIDVLSFIGTKS